MGTVPPDGPPPWVDFRGGTKIQEIELRQLVRKWCIVGPQYPDATNAEAKILDKNSHMYLVDGPSVNNSGLGPGTSPISRVTYVGNFETFVRVDIKETGPRRLVGGSINNSNCTQDPKVLGSRVSDPYLWSIRHTLVTNDAGTALKRTTGDANETDENSVKDGHTTI